MRPIFSRLKLLPCLFAAAAAGLLPAASRADEGADGHYMPGLDKAVPQIQKAGETFGRAGNRAQSPAFHRRGFDCSPFGWSVRRRADLRRLAGKTSSTAIVAPAKS